MCISTFLTKEFSISYVLCLKTLTSVVTIFSSYKLIYHINHRSVHQKETLRDQHGGTVILMTSLTNDNLLFDMSPVFSYIPRCFWIHPSK